jgi:6-phosphogluconate dehydrogenase
MDDHGFTVCAFNRTTSKVDKFLANEAKGTKIVGAHSPEEMCAKLKKPRRVMLLVQAGRAVDATIDSVLPFLDAGDIIIDGGNSQYDDTIRRYKDLGEKGFLFVGSGVSGGEEGARYGPSIMPGGNPEAWPHIKDIFQGISAKVGDDACCDWVGPSGAGHYVKMVHNGIEYGDMQLCCEAYHLMKVSLGMSPKEMSGVFGEWNKSELDSYLIEITAEILGYTDEKGEPLVEKILDKSGQKGTGKWTAISALEQGMPVTLIGESVYARCLSALQKERLVAATQLKGPDPTYTGNKTEFVEHIRQALYASKIVSYAQGFMLLRAAAVHYGWELNYPAIALMWRGGCIIRSRFLGDIKNAFEKDPALVNLLLDDFFKDAIHSAQASWRLVVSQAALLGIPVPAFSCALAFYDGYRCARLPANLIQAQRDYFGAHTYELLGAEGEWHHTNWTGRGGDVSSSTYNA